MANALDLFKKDFLERTDAPLEIRMKFQVPQGRCCFPPSLFGPQEKKPDPIFKVPASPTELKDPYASLALWIPEHVLENDSFYSVNRVEDPCRLAGIRYRPSSDFSMEEKMFNFLTLIAREGGLPNLILAHSSHDLVDFHTWNFSYFDMKGFKIFLDESCPKNLIYALSLKSWTHYVNFNQLVTDIPFDNGVLILD